MVSALLLSLICTDLPKSIQNQIDDGRAVLEREVKESRARMLTEFDDQKQRIGKATDVPAEKRIEALDALAKERRAFELRNSVPLSVSMRPATQDYLKKIQLAQLRQMRILDNAANIATREGDTALARKLVADRKAIPFCVVQWDCQYLEPNGRIRTWRWNCFSDGTVNPFADDKDVHPKSWAIGPKNINLVILNVTADSPKGGFKDVCTLHPDGTKFDARNQSGGVYTGVRAE